MTRIEPDTEHLLHRYMDRELPPLELQQFELRLEREPGLAQALEELRALRRMFREPPVAVPTGLTERVLAAVHRAPFDSAATRDLHDVARASRRILLAAALLVGLALVLLATSWRSQDPGRLEASPDELQGLIERVRSRPPEPWAERAPERR